MRNAPSVEYPVGRSVFERKLQAALIFLWVGMQSLWAVNLGFVTPPGAWWASLLGGVAAAAYGWWRLKHQPVGVLRWDVVSGSHGQWHWVSDGSSKDAALLHVNCMLDLQAVLLLKLVTKAEMPLWIWLERRQSAPPQWDALRRALKAHGQMSRTAQMPDLPL